LDEAIQNQALLGELKSTIQFGDGSHFRNVNNVEIAEASLDLELMNADPNQIIFRVQIGAYRYRLSKNVFNEVNNLLVIDGNDGLTRYVAGSFTDIREAAEYKVELLLKGYEGAFVTAYRGGKRITMKDAGATVDNNTKEDIRSNKEVGKMDKSLVKYTVQLETIEGRVPAEVLGQFMSLGGVRPVRGNNGITKYVYGSFQNMDEANKALIELKEAGFDKAIVAGDFNGQIIDVEEAIKIKTN
jgi:cell division protein FtsN